MNDPFLNLIRRINLTGWVRDFVEHTVNTESPASFRCMTGMAIVAAMLRRRTWINMGTFTIYPPIQTMLVGPAGASKKSTTARYGIEILDYVPEEMRPNQLPSAGTPEALIGRLKEILDHDGDTTGLQMVSELASYMGQHEYAKTLAQTLTELYDSPRKFNRETKANKKEYLENIGITAILCSNETWLSEAIPPTAIKGGFPSRVLMMYEKLRTRRIAFPAKHMPPKDEERALGERLTAFAFKRGECRIDHAAEVWHESWYENLPDAPTPDLEPFYARMQQHQLRLSMIIAAQENEMTQGQIHIKQHHMEAAQAILDYLGDRLPELYHFLATGRFGEEYHRILRLLKQAGGRMDRRDLGRRVSNSMNFQECETVLRTLGENGLVRSVTMGRDRFVEIVHED